MLFEKWKNLNLIKGWGTKSRKMKGESHIPVLVFSPKLFLNCLIYFPVASGLRDNLVSFIESRVPIECIQILYKYICGVTVHCVQGEVETLFSFIYITKIMSQKMSLLPISAAGTSRRDTWCQIVTKTLINARTTKRK